MTDRVRPISPPGSPPGSPLRGRMIEDMTVRRFKADTQRGYIAAVKRLTAFLGRSPDQATAEDLRRFQLHMRSEGASPTTMNAAVSALRFLFGVSLARSDAEVGMTTVREPRKLPVILSPAEVARLLDAAPGLKYRAALGVAYGAGLRAAEVVSLRVTDIDSDPERMVIRVEQGKGRMPLGGSRPLHQERTFAMPAEEAVYRLVATARSNWPKSRCPGTCFGKS